MPDNTNPETPPEDDFTILIQWHDGKSGQRLASGGSVPEKLKKENVIFFGRSAVCGLRSAVGLLENNFVSCN